MNKLLSLFSPQKLVGLCVNILSWVAPESAGKWALRLFCTPLMGRKFTSKEQKFFAGATQEKVALDDQELQVYVWGDKGKKILLAHGFNSHAGRWRVLIPLLLKEGYQVIAFDAPAHGASGWKQVDGVLYARAMEAMVHAYEPQVLIGHSFGGMAIAYCYANLSFKAVEKIIFLAVPSELSTIIQTFYEVLGLWRSSQKAMSKAFIHTFSFPIESVSVKQYIPSVAFPGLVIHDRDDPVIPFSEGEAIAKNWKTGEFLATEGLGHNLQSGRVFRAVVEEIGKSV